MTEKFRRQLLLFALPFTLAVGVLLGLSVARLQSGGGQLSPTSTDKDGQPAKLIDPMTSNYALTVVSILLFLILFSLVSMFVITMNMVDDVGHTEKKAYIVAMLMSGAPIRSITIALIVITVGFLAFFGRLTHEVAIILSGISGYVLGTMPRPKDNEESSSLGALLPGPPPSTDANQSQGPPPSTVANQSQGPPPSTDANQPQGPPPSTDAT